MNKYDDEYDKAYENEYLQQRNNARNILCTRYFKSEGWLIGIGFLTLMGVIPFLFIGSVRELGVILLIAAIGGMIWCAVQKSRFDTAIKQYDKGQCEKWVQRAIVRRRARNYLLHYFLHWVHLTPIPRITSLLGTGLLILWFVLCFSTIPLWFLRGC